MSDVEEPAAKISKVDTSEPGVEEELDEGHEEWLSEGLLTDDDGNTMQEERLDNTASHDSTLSSLDAEHAADDEAQNQTEDIEQALDDMENNVAEQDGTEAFLVRKAGSEETKVESELDESVRQSDDDGHDTDELLRMLGEDDHNGKIKAVKKKFENLKKDESSDDDDDEHMFRGANVRKLKVAKNVLMKKPAIKAEPEDMSDVDSFMSSDEATTVKKIFGVKRHNNVASKSTTKSGVIRPTITVTKKVVTVDRSGDKPELKSIKQEEPETHVKTEDVEQFYEEFLEEDFDEESVMEAIKENKQDIMKPEVMDEEVPSDCDSNSDEDSLYDDFPSSDSDDMEEWFTLDIRDERAGDYIPLLGHKAHKLLTEEKEKVAARIANLRESLSALTHSGKQQAEQLRKATATLAELDATLKAS
ncbi:uncharacterized protein LOC119838970 [Zerene cesonia]|uniref:uncharacterized protein LOC119838970 n=1 Tax=Zerene cesonia TaxID=33412 RepID=UPI0018E5A44B|nr:uncharacterized protein LOC119838970 [Zerene cesonia]